MRRGFTLIELLVVIAIIGVLASIVLASLQGGRDKANDVAIKANMASMRTQAELYATTNGSYGADMNHVATPCSAHAGIENTFFFLDARAKSALLAAEEKSGNQSRCVVADGNAWALAVRLTASTSATATWCVDSSGSTKELASLPNFGSATAVCP
jgi:prepilin-type N-terminal cleavage/methylation domain-containing protein